MLNRKTAPDIVNAVDFNLHLKPYRQFFLDNNVPVYAVDAGSQDVLMLEFVFFAGNWYEEKNIVAATTNYMLKSGTKHKTAFEINEYFEMYGAYLNCNCFNETSTVTLHTLSKHVSKLLPVVGELLTDAVFPEEELSIYKQNRKQRLSVNLKKCDFVANRLMDEELFGSHHPYGRYTSAEDFDALTREDLISFYNEYYANGTCMLFVAGRLPQDIQEQLNKNFGHLPFNKHTVPDKTFISVHAQEKKHNVINDAAGVQSAIRIARPFPNRHHPDFPKVQVLNNILGGFFGSRLMTNIREDKGYTYGIRSYLQNHVQESAWVISTEAGRDVCSATISEVYKEMDKLRKEPVKKEELDLVRNYMMGMLLGDLDGPFQIIARWKTYILNNLNEHYFYNTIQTIRTVGAEELLALANQYLQEDEFYELTVV
jgi:predicted Zn-dependent peptidase